MKRLKRFFFPILLLPVLLALPVAAAEADTAQIYGEQLEASGADDLTATLPEENLQAMIDYYQSMYTGGNPGLVAYDENDGDAVLTPFCAGGQGEDGNMYCIFVCVLYGYTITVVGGTSADSFDDDTYGAAFDLYWSTVTSFVDCMTEE